MREADNLQRSSDTATFTSILVPFADTFSPLLAFLLASECSKYKLMESNMDKIKQSMKEKVPEIKRSLELVKHLQERQVSSLTHAYGAAP